MPTLNYLIHLSNLAACARAVQSGAAAGTGTSAAPNVAALAQALGVDRRTVFRYLNTLRDEFGAPLEYDRDAEGYRLTKPWRFERALLRWLRRPVSGE